VSIARPLLLPKRARRILKQLLSICTGPAGSVMKMTGARLKLEDNKYGRQEGHVINRILKGWAKQKVDDHELLKRGMDLIEGLYVSIV
jgi:hypothetical protein